MSPSRRRDRFGKAGGHLLVAGLAPIAAIPPSAAADVTPNLSLTNVTITGNAAEPAALGPAAQGTMAT